MAFIMSLERRILVMFWCTRASTSARAEVSPRYPMKAMNPESRINTMKAAARRGPTLKRSKREVMESLGSRGWDAVASTDQQRALRSRPFVITPTSNGVACSQWSGLDELVKRVLRQVMGACG
ncbi:exported hypothetical protein [Xanthomonas phaseoli pv. phaseoli]|uniref:Uncharacterized protein n=1 Tax=Xanthomonas campestris pv. phaseoli TaxID=317013 RepID=A0A7Z7NH66_XANCH|nr:exported hypothetical protein [Xanthomonas phaseoli pv. phaseoli]